MRLPLKLNEACLPAALKKIMRGQADPRILLQPNLEPDQFSKAVSVLKFGNTFKTTEQNRFPQTIKMLSQLLASEALIILDLGASDGITALDLLPCLKHRLYYITDLNPEVYYRVDGKWTYFYDSEANSLLAVSEKFLIYKDSTGAIKPIRDFVDRFYKKNSNEQIDKNNRIELVNPALKKHLSESVIFQRYNALETWPGEKVDLIIAANLLNRSYFSEQELSTIMHNIVEALKKPGWVALVDNRKTEQSTIIRIEESEVLVEARIGNGSEVEALFLNVAG